MARVGESPILSPIAPTLQAPPVSTEAAPDPTEARARHRPEGGLRVLVVEDEAGDRWYFSEILRSRDFDVTSCASGEAAWELFLADPPSLVLLDLMLPGMDGADLCRRIRRHPLGWEPVILAVTGREEPDALRDVLEAGADDFVRKPVSPEVLDIRLSIAERRLRDRIERRGTKEALESKTWELERLFRNLPDVFFSVDVTAGRLIQVSPAAASMLGHSPEELHADPALWRALLLPPQGDADVWQAVLDGRAAERFIHEYAVTLPDGSGKWLRASVSLEHDPVTGDLRADGFLLDATEEHRARTELAGRNEELAALYRVSELTLTSESLEVAHELILGEVARIMDVPIVLLEHLDRAQDRLTITAAHGADFADGDDLEIPLHQTPSGLAVQTGKPVVVRDPGNRRELAQDVLLALQPRMWGSFPLFAGGVVAGTLTLIDTRPRDVDDRWIRLGTSLAATIAAFLERLEAEDALRENESRYRRLAAQFQQANQELESFAYSVSHDLRAPLRTMQGFAHALLQDHGESLGEEARDYARRIIASGRQSERLITDLLAYSRLSFEKLEMKPVELVAVVEQALEQVEADLRESGAHVEVQRRLPIVLGNHTALIQVLTNLVSNAVKFTSRDRRPEVRIRAEERGERVRLWVEDSGIGIPEGQEERIFRVFERLAESGDHPGTGIGLAIVRRGMQRINGSCGVERLADGGSAFWIEAMKERRKARRPWSRRGHA